MQERKYEALPEGVMRAEEVNMVPRANNTVIQRTPSSRVLRAYQDFFDLGETRTLPALREMYVEMERLYGPGAAPTTSLSTLRRWSTKWNWQLQIRIDSGHLYNQRRNQRMEAMKSVGERQSQASRILQQISLKRLQSLVTPTGELSDEGKELSPAEARRMLLEGARLEREIIGGKLQELSSEINENEIRYE
jgi:hypothetical protein